MYTTQDFLNDCATHKERLAATLAKEKKEREAREEANRKAENKEQ